MSNPGKIYMIPSAMGDRPVEEVIPEGVRQIIGRLNCFAVENVRSARRFIRSVDKQKNIDELEFFNLDKRSDKTHIEPILSALYGGNDVGVISEAGAPGVADPGALLVEEAHNSGITVVPTVGPSSIFLALMASGMNGQGFAFHGYLPIQEKARREAVKRLETQVHQQGQTQIFMETPYRNNQLLKDIFKACSPETKLCIAVDITSAAESIETMKIRDWKKVAPDLHKRPAIFLLGK